MPNNPIEKITDDGFTSTSKGLLTLFTIGVIKIFLGIEFTSSTISIPWLPTVEIYNFKNIIYLYWALVAYAIHRYVIHNYHSFKKTSYNILSDYIIELNDGKNKKIISLFYLDEFNTQVVKSHMSDINSVTIYCSKNNTTQVDSYQAKPCFQLQICYSNRYRLKSILILISHINKQEINFDKLKKKLKCKEINNEINNETVYLAQRIPLRFKVFQFSIFVQQLLKNKDLYDISMPIILNILLFFYWCAMQYVG